MDSITLADIYTREAEILWRLERLEGMLAYWFWRTYTNQGLSSAVAEQEARGVDVLEIDFPEESA